MITMTTNLRTAKDLDNVWMNYLRYKDDVAKISIKTSVDSQWGTNLLGLINKELKGIEDLRKVIVKPYNDIVNLVNKKAKEKRLWLEAIKWDLQTKMLTYQKEVDRIRIEEEKVLEEQRKIAEKEAESKEDKEEIKEIVTVEKDNLDYQYKTNKAKWTYIDYEIISVDKRKVSEEYLEVKEWAIRTALRKWIKLEWVEYEEVTKIK